MEAILFKSLEATVNFIDGKTTTKNWNKETRVSTNTLYKNGAYFRNRKISKRHQWNNDWQRKSDCSLNHDTSIGTAVND